MHYTLSASLCLLYLFAMTGNAQDPSTTATFGDVVSNMAVINNYTFGTASGRAISTLSELEASFDPYGIAGTQVINEEWERYQPFNAANFVFGDDYLNLTATIPSGGGLFSGGIHSGQIWSHQLFQPGVTGANVYAFEVRMMIPTGPGMWPAAWFYAKEPSHTDGSEIDNPEFYDMKWQNEFDWTGYNHGPGVGAQLYSIKTNQWVWHPKLNFSADYHDYQTVWTQDAVYKYVDGTLIYAQHFKWTSSGTAQLGINLAVGSSNTSALPGLEPTSLGQFPSSLSIKHIRIWAK